MRCKIICQLLWCRCLQPFQFKPVGVLPQSLLLPCRFLVAKDDCVLTVAYAVADEKAVEDEAFQGQCDAEEEAGIEL